MTCFQTPAGQSFIGYRVFFLPLFSFNALATRLSRNKPQCNRLYLLSLFLFKVCVCLIASAPRDQGILISI